MKIIRDDDGAENLYLTFISNPDKEKVKLLDKKDKIIFLNSNYILNAFHVMMSVNKGFYNFKQRYLLSLEDNITNFVPGMRIIIPSINKTYEVPQKGSILNPQDVDFNKNVVNSFLKHSQTLGMELFEAYPAYTIINGRTFSLRNVTKLFKSLDDMCFEYGKAIKFNPDLHKEVLELLEWGKENGKISYGICEFIISAK